MSNKRKNSKEIIRELYPNFHAERPRLTIPPAPECKKFHPDMNSAFCPTCGKRVRCGWIPYAIWYILVTLVSLATAYFVLMDGTSYVSPFYELMTNLLYPLGPLAPIFIGLFSVLGYSSIRYKRDAEIGYPLLYVFVIATIFMGPITLYLVIGGVGCFLGAC